MTNLADSMKNTDLNVLVKNGNSNQVDSEIAGERLESISGFDSDFMKTHESDKISFERSDLQNISKIKKTSKENSQGIFTR